MKRNAVIGIVVGIAVLAVIFFMFGKKESGIPQQAVDEFAKCLTEKGTVMYGAYWCPHCARVKKSFGSSFRYVKYIECDPRGDNEQSELCLSKGIDKYATWEFTDGSRLVGEPSFQELSEKTGCAAPAGNS